MATPEKIQFHYIKSNHFKSFFASGAYGGVGPNGLINMGFYIERTPIPQTVAHKITPEGTVAEEIDSERKGKTGIIREIDCNIMITIDTARSIQTWLGDQIKILETVQKINLKKEE